MNNLPLPPLNPLITTKIQPRLMKDTYKKVHIYLFDFDIVLGKGSFSKVYKGINLNTNQQVAVKVIEMGSVNTPKLKQLLLQQIDILMKVKNENLIKCFEVLSSTKNTYIIMELCTYDFGSICDFIQKQQEKEKTSLMEKQNNKFMHTFEPYDNFNHSSYNSTQCTTKNTVNHLNHGINASSESLTQSINSISSTKSVQFEDSDGENEKRKDFRIQEKLKEEKFYPFIKQIFEGLEYLQKQNIVHRDLKLSNIFLSSTKACKIGDFGFATIIPSNQLQIKDTCCIGSPLYMSPESYIQNIYSLKSDIWSFGILIFEMIYGNPPHWNCPTHEILKSEIKRPINLSKFDRIATISDELKQVIEGCLQVEVRKRFSIAQLKKTKLFQRLFYQPLQSHVVVNSRNNHKIQESNVQILGDNLRKDSNGKIHNDNYCEFSNFSTIQNVKDNFDGMFGLQNERYFFNNSKSPANLQNRRSLKSQTLKQNQKFISKNSDQLNNNSFTDRLKTVQEQKRNKSINSKQFSSFNEISSLNEMKFKSTDLNGNIFKQVNKLKQKSEKYSENEQFLYKNSEGMQKFLKQMNQTKKINNQNQHSEIHLLSRDPITFTDLSNLLDSPKKKGQIKVFVEEKQSPKFASTFNGPFFSSKNYQKQSNQFQKAHLNKNTSSSSYFKPMSLKQGVENLINNNNSMFEKNNNNASKPYTLSSPRNNPSFNFAGTSYERKEDKNIEKDSLLTKNYSTGMFETQKNYSAIKNNEKYEYKKKLLEKCTSSPRFETFKNDPNIESKRQQESSRHMTTSSFFGNKKTDLQRTSKDVPANIIKDFNQKQESKNNNRKNDIFMRTLDGSSNLLAQFSTKANQQSHIHKKTYWKGTNNKNFGVNSAEKSTFHLQRRELQNDKQNTLSPRNFSSIYATATESQSPKFTQNASFKKGSDDIQNSSNPQSFKLLNGQLIIKDACELIHFSRLLHKLSFLTESNSSSILLLQYAIQILSNLQQKCQNFQIKYHYDSSTNNSGQIREAFKLNENYLANLSITNEKECYAIKKDMSLINKENSSTCNKTVQLKSMVQAYIKKYKQRKEALIKLFQCNALFQNLTNKVKQVKPSSNLGKPAFKKRTSLAFDKGYLNFIKLEKALEQIQVDIFSKKQIFNPNTVVGQKQVTQNTNNCYLLIQIARVYVDSINKCNKQRTFIYLVDTIEDVIEKSIEIDAHNLKCKSKSPDCNGNSKSIIEKVLEVCNNDHRINQKSFQNNMENDQFLTRNASFMPSNTCK